MNGESEAKRLHIGKQHIIIFVIIAVVCFVAGMKYCEYLAQQQPETAVVEEPGLVEVEAASAEIMVHVKGAVEQAGVIALPAGSRVVDAVHMAGTTATADLEAINLSRVLNDQDEVIVPERAASAGSSASAESGMTGESGGKINLNRATSEQLQSLSGIGPVKAESIIAYRENVGQFTSIEEVKNVSGISDSLFEKIQGEISV